jgi:hypothetical protein
MVVNMLKKDKKMHSIKSCEVMVSRDFAFSLSVKVRPFIFQAEHALPRAEHLQFTGY